MSSRSRAWCGTSDRKVSHSLHADSIRREVDGSLQRLGVDVIDLYQIHWPRWGSSPAGWDPGSIEEGWQAMADLQKAGKVRYIGASNFTRDDLARAHAVAPVTSLQPPYSLLRREAEADLFPWCLEHGTGVIVYSPMQSGLLTGTMTRERLAALPEQRLAAEGQVLPGAVPDSRRSALVERLRPWARATAARLAKWRLPGRSAIPPSPPRSSAPGAPNSSTASSGPPRSSLSDEDVALLNRQ